MAKANRQLQDPLVIMTGNLPQWLPEIGAVWYVLIILKVAKTSITFVAPISILIP